MSFHRLTEFYNNVRAPFPFSCNQCQCRRQSPFQRGRPLHNEARPPHTCAESYSLPSGLLSTADSETTTLSIQTPFPGPPAGKFFGSFEFDFECVESASTLGPPGDDSWKVHWLTRLPALYEQVYHSTFRVAAAEIFVEVPGRQTDCIRHWRSFISVTESGPNAFPRTHGRSVVVPGHVGWITPYPPLLLRLSGITTTLRVFRTPPFGSLDIAVDTFNLCELSVFLS
ncbi:hypothetical protein EDC04DRAFT_2627021 [Pisolithus marmoratus]|nr:hypothetical protein EDC04DRAFT_2627021 [Pisolithus marmoratus]